ncbi:phage N-6-adenine-methyltransferase [Pantoea sp. FN0307]|uniref:phage N-6-adenine-methyltransferase n=1 Tax=unclassified Pantoea TaxID=2630326 RepID=UPI003CEAD02F
MTDYTGSNTPPDIQDFWQTPVDLFLALDREFHFVADIAASDANHRHPVYLTEADDALAPETNWEMLPDGYLWCNPPYNDIGPWVQKANALPEGSHGVVMLVPADTSVGWFKEALKEVTEVRFITGGRISFVRADTGKPVNGNNKGSMLLIWNPLHRRKAMTSYVDHNELMVYGKHLASIRSAA